MNKRNKAILESMHIRAIKASHPNFPEYAYPAMGLKDTNTNELTKCVIQFLKWCGHQAERISNTGRVISNKKKVVDSVGFVKIIGSDKYIPGTGRNGTADISSIVFGLSLKIEIKFGKDRQSDVQKEYQAEVESAGGIYILGKTFDGFIEDYERIIRSRLKVYKSASGVEFVIFNDKKRLIHRLDNFETLQLNEKQFERYR